MQGALDAERCDPGHTDADLVPLDFDDHNHEPGDDEIGLYDV